MIKNVTKNTIIAENELIARTFFDRGTGLLFRKFIAGKMDGMIFERCSSLHTFFMRYDFDIFFNIFYILLDFYIIIVYNILWNKIIRRL